MIGVVYCLWAFLLFAWVNVITMALQLFIQRRSFIQWENCYTMEFLGLWTFSWVTVGRSVVGSLFHNLLSFCCEILSIVFEFLSVSLFLLSSHLIDIWVVRFKRKTLLATGFNLWQFVFISGNSF
jgi:hypothetical protein